MEVNRKKLQEALEIVKPGLSNKDVIEQSTAFAFIKGRVVTYNDEISVSHPVEGLEELTGALEADKLYPLLAKMTSDTVDISLNEKSEIVIKSGRTKAGLTLQAEIKLPLDEEIAEKGKWKPLPENFIKGVAFVMTASSSEQSRPVLCCVHVNEQGYVEASDGYRIARHMLDKEMPSKTFLFRSESAVALSKLNPTKIAEGKGWVHFKTSEDTVFSCRILEDAFPNTSSFLSVEGTRLILPKTINEVLDRALVFAKRDSVLEEAIKITLGKNRLKVNAEAETGWFEEELNMKFDQKETVFSITPYLLKKIVNETQTCTLGKTMLKFEGDGWQYVSLLRQ